MSWKTAFFVIIAALVFSRYAPAEMVGDVVERCTDARLGLTRQVRQAALSYVQGQESGRASKKLEASISMAQIQRRKARCLFKIVERQVGEETLLRDLRGGGGAELGEYARALRAHADQKALTCHSGLAAQELSQCRLQVTENEIGALALVQVIYDLGKAVEDAVRANSNQNYEQFVESYGDDLRARIGELRGDLRTGLKLEDLKQKQFASQR